MAPLLVLTALLLLASGLVKVKAADRVQLGVPALALLELLAGVGLFSVAFIQSFTPRQGLLVLVASVALLVVSSLQVGSAIRRRHRIREASEGARLANYVNVLSRLPGAGEGEAQDAPSASRRGGAGRSGPRAPTGTGGGA